MARDANLAERCLIVERVKESVWHGINVTQASQHVIELRNASRLAILEGIRMHCIFCKFRGMFQEMEQPAELLLPLLFHNIHLTNLLRFPVSVTFLARRIGDSSTVGNLVYLIGYRANHTSSP